MSNNKHLFGECGKQGLEMSMEEINNPERFEAIKNSENCCETTDSNKKCCGNCKKTENSTKNDG